MIIKIWFNVFIFQRNRFERKTTYYNKQQCFHVLTSPAYETRGEISQTSSVNSSHVVWLKYTDKTHLHGTVKHQKNSNTCTRNSNIKRHVWLSILPKIKENQKPNLVNANTLWRITTHSKINMHKVWKL